LFAIYLWGRPLGALKFKKGVTPGKKKDPCWRGGKTMAAKRKRRWPAKKKRGGENLNYRKRCRQRGGGLTCVKNKNGGKK